MTPGNARSLGVHSDDQRYQRQAEKAVTISASDWDILWYMVVDICTYIYSWDCIWLGYINYCIYKWTYRVDDFVSTMDSWTWKLSLVSGGVRCAWHAKMREMSRMVMAKCPSEKQYGTELFETQLKKYGCWCRSNFLVSAGHLGVTHHKKWIEMNRNG